MKKVINDKEPVIKITDFRSHYAQRFTVDGIKGNVTVFCNVKVGTWPNNTRYMFKPNDKIKINKDGEMVIPDLYDSASNFSEGLACVKEDGDDLYGYIDEDGESVDITEPDYMAAIKEITDNRSKTNHNVGVACIERGGVFSDEF